MDPIKKNFEGKDKVLDAIVDKQDKQLSEELDPTPKEKTDPETQKKQEKKNNTVLFILGLIILAIIAYGLYVSFFESIPEYEGTASVDFVSNTQLRYNGFLFQENRDGTWSTEVYNPFRQVEYGLGLRYNPIEVEDIPFEVNYVSWLEYAGNFEYVSSDNTTTSPQTSQGATFILFDPDKSDTQEALAYLELENNLAEAFLIQPFAALTHSIADEREFAIKSCQDTAEPIIYLRQDPVASVYQDGEHCLVIQGSGEDLVRGANKLLYHFYGIMGQP